jgi:hypothetical protein
MTIEEVLATAREMDPALRAALWEACGIHPAGRLLEADADGAGSVWRYCAVCWTVFDRSGSYAVNAPQLGPATRRVPATTAGSHAQRDEQLQHSDR